jgi:hypothetical protein
MEIKDIEKRLEDPQYYQSTGSLLVTMNFILFEILKVLKDKRRKDG